MPLLTDDASLLQTIIVNVHGTRRYYYFLQDDTLLDSGRLLAT